ncbi:Major facilitator super domain-containing protein 7, partial [Physocladia obscura]
MGDSTSTAETNEASNSTNNNSYKLYVWRFTVTTGVFLAGGAGNIVFATYGSVTPTTAVRYNTSQTVINNLTLYYTAAFLVFSYPSMWLLDKKGLRVAMFAVALVNIVASLIRWLSFAVAEEYQLALLHIGHILGGIVSPITISAPTMTAAAWFSGNGRLTANTVMTLAGPLGSALVAGVAPLVVSDDDPATVDTWNLVIFIIALVFGLTALLVFDKPLTPPSPSEEKKSAMPITFRESITQIWKNKPFWILLAVFSCLIAILNMTSTVISSFVVPYGYTEDDSGNLAVAAIAAGLIGSIIVAMILDRTKKHKLAVKFSAFLSFLGFAVFTFAAMDPSRIIVAYIAAAVFGLGAVPCMSLAMELGVECTYPIGEEVSTGFLWSFAQLFTMILLVLSNFTRDGEGKMGVLLIVVSVVLFLVFFVSLLFANKNRRMAIEGVVSEMTVSDELSPEELKI